jgi:hypothetical protein
LQASSSFDIESSETDASASRVMHLLVAALDEVITALHPRCHFDARLT